MKSDWPERRVPSSATQVARTRTRPVSAGTLGSTQTPASSTRAERLRAATVQVASSWAWAGSPMSATTKTIVPRKVSRVVLIMGPISLSSTR